MNRIALMLMLIFAIANFLFCGILVESAKSQFLGSVYISDNGSVVGTDTIQRSGNIYTLTANISGGIQVQKSNIVIDGAGYAIEGNGEGDGIDLSNGRGQDPSRTEINNVTIKNLKILNFYYGVDNANTNNNTFIGNYIENCQSSLWIIGSLNNIITYNTMNNASIAINYAGSNDITKNNFINCWVMVWLSTQPIVDGNYWSDYTTRYPDAKEIGNTGVWDTPYAYWENSVDNHPLMKPIAGSVNDTPDGAGEIEPFPTLLVIAVAVTTVAVVAIGLSVYFKKRKRVVD
jgi:hypothetical protein